MLNSAVLCTGVRTISEIYRGRLILPCLAQDLWRRYLPVHGQLEGQDFVTENCMYIPKRKQIIVHAGQNSLILNSSVSCHSPWPNQQLQCKISALLLHSPETWRCCPFKKSVPFIFFLLWNCFRLPNLNCKQNEMQFLLQVISFNNTKYLGITTQLNFCYFIAATNICGYSLY